MEMEKWKKQIKKMLKQDRVIGVSVKIFVKNQHFPKNILIFLAFFNRYEVDFKI